MIQQAVTPAHIVSESALVAAVRQWIERANSRFDLAVPVPQVRMDLRGRSAGLTVYARRHRHRALIRFNVSLCERYPEEMLDHTVPHEVAHVVTAWQHGSRVKPHGPEWQHVMAAFDRPATVCHNMAAAPARRHRYFPYRCDCEELRYLSATRHNRVRRGAGYSCTRCRGRLVFTGDAPIRR